MTAPTASVSSYISSTAMGHDEELTPDGSAMYLSSTPPDGTLGFERFERLHNVTSAPTSNSRRCQNILATTGHSVLSSGGYNPESPDDWSRCRRMGSSDGLKPRRSFDSSRGLSATASMQSLHKEVEKLMLSDTDTFRQVKESLAKVEGGLAMSTDRLQVGRDETGATCINQYVVVKTLGRGSFGKVKLCLNTLDNELYAVKMVNRSFLQKQLQKPKGSLRKRGANRSLDASGFAAPGQRNPLEALTHEIAVMKKMDHANIVKLHEVIDPAGSPYLMLVMEYMEQGAVQDNSPQEAFQRFSEGQSLEYFGMMCSGLDYMHYNKIVHGDLKPGNLLLNANGQLKLADFGSSVMLNTKTAAQKVAGTPAFHSPEIVAGIQSDPFQDDVWALGVCLYCFVYGRLPFPGATIMEVYGGIKEGGPSYPDEIPTSPQLRDLFTRLFDKDASQRITLEGIMGHPWLAGLGMRAIVPLSEMAAPPSVIHVSADEQRSAIDRSSIVSMIKARMKEKVFADGQNLYREGTDADTIYFIVSGVVELISTVFATPTPMELPALLPSGPPTGVDASFTIDLDESFMLEAGDTQQQQLDRAMVAEGRVHIDRTKAHALKQRRRSQLLTAGEAQEVVIATKGPGQVVGEVPLGNQPHGFTHSARAKGPVTVLKLTENNLATALSAAVDMGPNFCNTMMGDTMDLSTATFLDFQMATAEVPQLSIGEALVRMGSLTCQNVPESNANSTQSNVVELPLGLTLQQHQQHNLDSSLLTRQLEAHRMEVDFGDLHQTPGLETVLRMSDFAQR